MGDVMERYEMFQPNKPKGTGVLILSFRELHPVTETLFHHYFSVMRGWPPDFRDSLGSCTVRSEDGERDGSEKLFLGWQRGC